MRLASSLFSIFIERNSLADLAGSVDDIDAVKARRRRTVRHGAHLRRLTFAIEEGTEHAPVAVVAQGGAGVPEFLGIGLVGNIFDLLGDLAVLDLEEELAAELEVVALLV